MSLLKQALAVGISQSSLNSISVDPVASKASLDGMLDTATVVTPETGTTAPQNTGDQKGKISAAKAHSQGLGVIALALVPALALVLVGA